MRRKRLLGRAEQVNSESIHDVEERGGYKAPEKIGLRSLVRIYLCERGASECVRTRQCACLDKCRYGQRYIDLTEENHDQ